MLSKKVAIIAWWILVEKLDRKSHWKFCYFLSHQIPIGQSTEFISASDDLIVTGVVINKGFFQRCFYFCRNRLYELFFHEILICQKVMMWTHRNQLRGMFLTIIAFKGCKHLLHGKTHALDAEEHFSNQKETLSSDFHNRWIISVYTD